MFAVIQALAFLDFFKSRMTNDNFKKLVGFSLLIMFVLGLLIITGLTYAGNLKKKSYKLSKFLIMMICVKIIKNYYKG